MARNPKPQKSVKTQAITKPKIEKVSAVHLQVLEQIHVSSIQRDSLRPGQQIVVEAGQANELLQKHPDKFKKLATPKNKAEPSPLNKGEGANE